METTKLKVIATGHIEEFEAEHAKRILSIPNSGWETVENTKDERNIKQSTKQGKQSTD